MRIAAIPTAEVLALYHGGAVLGGPAVYHLSIHEDGSVVTNMLSDAGGYNVSTDGTRACWGSGQQSISCSLLDGGSAIVVSGDDKDVCCPVIHGAYVYWLAGRGTLRRARWDTGRPMTVVGADGSVNGPLALDGDRLLWLASEQASPSRYLLVTASPREDISAEDAGAADAGIVATLPNYGDALAIARDAYYVAVSGSSLDYDLYRALRDAGGGPAMLVVNHINPNLATDDSHAYYTNFDDIVYRIPLDTSIRDGGLVTGAEGGPTAIARARGYIIGFGVDDRFVYWLEYWPGGGLMRLAK